MASLPFVHFVLPCYLTLETKIGWIFFYKSQHYFNLVSFLFYFQIQSSKYAKIGPKQSKCPRIIAGQPGGLPVPAQSKFDRGNRRGNHRNGFAEWAAPTGAPWPRRPSRLLAVPTAAALHVSWVREHSHMKSDGFGVLLTYTLVHKPI